MRRIRRHAPSSSSSFGVSLGRHAPVSGQPSPGGAPRPGDPGHLRTLTTRRLTRQQRWRLVGAVAALVLVGTTVRALWAAEAARAAWSSTTRVLVATRDLPAGAVLTTSDLRVVGLPDAVAPPGAATGRPEAFVGVTVTRPIFAGEPVAPARLGLAGLGPTAALLPTGWRAVALPRATTAPPLAPGDRVEIVAVAGGPGTAAPARVVSSDAEVLVVVDDTITVAVPANKVTDVVAAAAQGLVATVLVGA